MVALSLCQNGDALVWSRFCSGEGATDYLGELGPVDQASGRSLQPGVGVGPISFQSKDANAHTLFYSINFGLDSRLLLILKKEQPSLVPLSSRDVRRAMTLLCAMLASFEVSSSIAFFSGAYDVSLGPCPRLVVLTLGGESFLCHLFLGMRTSESKCKLLLFFLLLLKSRWSQCPI